MFKNIATALTVAVTLSAGTAALAGGDFTCQPAGTRSGDNGPATTIGFTNNGQASMTLYWIDFDGNEVAYQTAQAGGGQVNQETFANHAWVIKNDATGACVL